MAENLVLLTGATGFVGFKALVTLLKSGFRVRCAVRSKSGADKIMATPSLRSMQPSEKQLTWVIVPDITVPNAYDEAVKGIKYIIHCASPVVKLRPDGRQGTDDEIYVNPAVQGVVGMLESAAAHAGGTVKRIVVTSSIVAIMPRSCFRGEGLDRPAFTGESRLPWPAPPYEDAYSASKTAALEASEKWMKEHGPTFDLISIMPAWIFGREELATTPEALLSGSNGVLLEFLRGHSFGWTINTGYVSVDDVVDAHIRALSPSVPGGKSFILSKHVVLEDARDFAKKNFPGAFANGVFREDSEQPMVSIPTDESEGEKLLGRGYENCEDVVKEVAAQYVKLVEECK